MSFNITQCPSCDSTFNTTARLLESAQGKVRCGACLTVFNAQENLVDTDLMEDSEQLRESVFLGNNPDYVDPTRFISRSDLTREDDPALGDKQTPIDEPIEDEPFEPFEKSIDANLEEAVLDNFAAEVFEQETEQALEAQFQPHAPPEARADTEAAPSIEQPKAESESGSELPPDAELKAATEPHQEPESVSAADVEPELEPESIAETDAGLEPKSEAIAETDTEPEPEPEAIAETDAGPELEREPESEPESSGKSQPLAEPLQATPTAPKTEPQLVRLHASFSMVHPAALDQQSANTTETESETDSKPAATTPTEPTDQKQQTATTEDFLTSVAESAEQPNIDEEQAEGSINDDFADNPDLDLNELPGADPEASQFFEIEEITPEANEAGNEIGNEIDSIETDQEQETETWTTTEAAPETEQQIDDTAVIRARALESNLEDEESPEPLPEEALAAAHRVSTPLELVERHRHKRLRHFILLLVSLLLGSLLVSQYMWRNQQIYAQHVQLRAVYEFACQWLQCELPVFRDINAIRSDNLAVRSHPEVDNALLVNINFRNTANYPQPFPILILSFNSATDAVIALREFAPTEYLPAELQSQTMMPSGTPVQIDLELIDPGPDAVNYTIAFRQPGGVFL